MHEIPMECKRRPKVQKANFLNANKQKKKKKSFCLKFEKFFFFACCLPIKEEQKKSCYMQWGWKKREGKMRE